MTFSNRLKALNEALLGQPQWQTLFSYSQHLAETLDHGDMKKWLDAIEALEAGRDPETALRVLHPWRKGPLRTHGVFIDTEWRSDWKWQRLLDAGLDLKGKSVLDVGCGNGFYMFEMLKVGAESVIGVDPTLLFCLQFMALQFEQQKETLAFLPSGLESLPETPESFDTVFSMGVLYHRKDHLQHLNDLYARLSSGGELVLETLILDGDGKQLLEPAIQGNKRYAQMRNVWSVPSLSLLTDWVHEAGFKNVTVLDQTFTTTQEQRSTYWMQFNSLSDFLDPEDPSKTKEGYQAPLRVILHARK